MTNKINEIYSNIRLLEDRSRGVGKTAALVKAAKSVSNGVIITNTWSVAQMINKEYDVETCSLDKLDTLRGRDCALFYDNTAIMQLASRSVVENQKLEEENKKTKMNLYKINVNAISCIKESFDEVCNELKDKDFITNEEYDSVKITLQSFLDTYESVHYDKPRFITFKANDYNYDKCTDFYPNFSSFNKTTSAVDNMVNDAIKTQDFIGVDMAVNNSLSKTINVEVSEFSQPNWNVSELKLPTDRLRGEAVNLAIIDDFQDISKTETGSHCQKCNYFNEYVSEDNYVCYSCKH